MNNETKHKINHRQRTVILNVIAGMNQTEAYERAYGPNPNSRFLASQLLNTPHIKAELERYQDRKADVIIANDVNNLIASPQERKQILTELLRAQLVDFQDNEGQPKLDKDTPNHRAAKEYYHRQKFDKFGNPIITRSIKLSDPIAAIQELNKMDGAYAPSKHLHGHIEFNVVHQPKLREYVDEPGVT